MKRLFPLFGLVALLAVSAAAQSIEPGPLLYSTSGRGVNWRQKDGGPASFPPVVVPNTTLTPGQFRGMVVYGAVTRPATPASLNTTKNYADNADAIGHPVFKDGTKVVMILRAAQVGAPWFARSSSGEFGSIISPPATTETGAPAPAGYWRAEPFASPYATHTYDTLRYYYSPHAGVVFATQAGQVPITWMKAQGAAAAPVGMSGTPDLQPGKVYYTEQPGGYFILTNTVYTISGTAVKTPQKIYWTEKSYQATGKLVDVPAARVGAVNVIYNSTVPKTNATEVLAIGQSLAAPPSDLLLETRTLWYDMGKIHAYNVEGRVFMELLGDATGGGNRQHLGFEIVDIFQQPSATDLTAELGEKIQPSNNPADAAAVADLKPEPLLTAVTGDQPFLYQSGANGGERVEYYATRETKNPNDALVYWMEAGVANLRWPKIYARYQFVWPTDVARYSHYVRAPVATEEEAKLTAVPLPNDNVPAIQYQDPLDRPRGKLSENFAYYTFLDASQPVHRGLLRFTAGDRVAFERVFSWLDVNLKSGDFANVVQKPVAGGLNWLTTRRVNGDWKLYVTDDASSATGSIGSWEILVITTNRLSASSATNTFTSAGGLTIPASGTLGNASPYPATITVSGISAPVVAVQVRLNNLTHAFPRDIDAFLVGPNGKCTILMSDNGPGFVPVGPGVLGPAGISGVTLLFADNAATQLSSSSLTRITSGTYRPLNGTDGDPDTYPPGFGSTTTATSLNALLLPEGTPDPTFINITPRVFSQTAYVGDRINAPADETGVNPAGYILQAQGNSFHPTAYRDPFVAGFDAAKQGAIIPVNAIPGAKNLEVWWFRPNSPNASSSGVRTEVNGFKTIYWPAVIGRYTLAWPTPANANYSEIVLASNDGSGGLGSLQAKGTIYTQNDPTLAGYNPNEEHAVMIGGQAYALRVDLNLVNSAAPVVPGTTYSSAPFVLLDYTESDARPALRAFQVLREKPTAGIVFDYIVQAGANASDKSGSKPLQAPMPLPFLPPPVEYVTTGVGAAATITKVNYNTEPSAPDTGADLPANWVNLSAADKSKYANYKSFTYRDRKDQFWVLRGVHAGLPALAAGKYNGTADAATISFATTLDAATAVVGKPFTNTFHVSRPEGSLVMTYVPATDPTKNQALPAGLTIDGLTLTGTPTGTALANDRYTFVITDNGDKSSVTVTLPLTVVSSGTVVAQQPKTFTSANQYTATGSATYTGRPPFLAAAPTPANSFTMRFYYKTQEGFAWPGWPTGTPQPTNGSIVPYLTPATVTDVTLKGRKETAALDIVYRPVWPGDPSKLEFGETLMAPVGGRPDIRGQSSALMLYQQAIAQNITSPKPAVVLHDPTREKTYLLKAMSTEGLDKLPDGVKTDSYQGRTYFPNLPPHLAKRFYLDPIGGPKGKLVFKGEYQEQGLSKHDWVLLNVLGGKATETGDLATVKKLCPASPTDQKAAWDGAIDELATVVETFYENPQVPGQFIVNPNWSVTNYVQTLTEITNSDTAVHSYALSASGPGQGYVTLIVGNGNVFTPPGAPVSVYVFP